jgi:hypothetical protein
MHVNENKTMNGGLKPEERSDIELVNVDVVMSLRVLVAINVLNVIENAGKIRSKIPTTVCKY